MIYWHDLFPPCGQNNNEPSPSHHHFYTVGGINHSQMGSFILPLTTLLHCHCIPIKIPMFIMC